MDIITQVLYSHLRMVGRDSKCGFEGLIRRLIPRLHDRGILTHDLSLPHNLDALESKYMGLCQVNKDGKIRRIGAF
jgi:hypothetical protein